MTGERPRLALVWAQSKNGVIGIDGKLPWNLTSDLEQISNDLMVDITLDETIRS